MLWRGVRQLRHINHRVGESGGHDQQPRGRVPQGQSCPWTAASPGLSLPSRFKDPRAARILAPRCRQRDRGYRSSAQGHHGAEAAEVHGRKLHAEALLQMPFFQKRSLSPTAHRSTVPGRCRCMAARAGSFCWTWVASPSSKHLAASVWATTSRTVSIRIPSTSGISSRDPGLHPQVPEPSQLPARCPPHQSQKVPVWCWAEHPRAQVLKRSDPR